MFSPMFLNNNAFLILYFPRLQNTILHAAHPSPPDTHVGEWLLSVIAVIEVEFSAAGQ